MKTQKVRKFAYQPRYYKIAEEEEVPRISFRRYRRSQKTGKKSTIGMLILVVIIIFLVGYWLKMDSPKNSEFQFEQIIIEEIE